MLLNIFILLLFLLLLIHNFKRGAMWISVLSAWLFMWKVPGYNSINLYVLLSNIALILYFLKVRKHFFTDLPFKWAIIFPFISFSVTAYFVQFKIVPLLELTSAYVFPFLIFNVIRTKEDIFKYLKYLGIYLSLLVGYTIFEEITFSNPIMDWCQAHPEHFGWLTSTYSVRYGFKRAQSFLLFSSALGGVCNYAFFLIAYLKIKKYKFINNPIFNILLFALPVCSLLTGTRSVIIPLFVICLSFINFSIFKRYWKVFSFIFIISIFVLKPFLGKIVDSIINSDNNTEISGSSLDMREQQFVVATYYMNQSPWYGNGLGFTGKVIQNDWEIRGAESIWLPLMMDQGIIGCICLALTFIFMIIYLLKYRMYSCIWVLLSFIIGKTISAMLGIDEGYYLISLLIIYRYLTFKEIRPKSLLYKQHI